MSIERNEYAEVSLENGDRCRIKKDGHVYRLIVDEFGCECWKWLAHSDDTHKKARLAAFAELAERQAADEQAEPEPAQQPDDGEPVKCEGNLLKVISRLGWVWVGPGGSGAEQAIREGVFHHIFDAAVRGLQKPESSVKTVDAKGWFYADSLTRVGREGAVQVFADGLWWYSELPRDERRAHAALFDAAKGAR